MCPGINSFKVCSIPPPLLFNPGGNTALQFIDAMLIPTLYIYSRQEHIRPTQFSLVADWHSNRHSHFTVSSFHAGSTGVHLEMSATNKRALKFYLKRGFSLLAFENETLPPDDVIILGRGL